MSFVFKNGCICVCWIGSLVLYVDSWKSSLTIIKVARYFSAECVRSLEEHKEKTGTKMERSLVPFHIRSQMTQMHRCYSKCVYVSLERHCSCLIRSNRSRIPNYFPDSWFRVSSVAIILHEIWSRSYYSFGILFYATSFVNPVLYIFWMTEFKALSLVLRCKPLGTFITHDHRCLYWRGFYVVSGKC